MISDYDKVGLFPLHFIIKLPKNSIQVFVLFELTTSRSNSE